VAFLAAAHNPRIRAGAFNHVAGWFGDVVWTGLATRHVRAGVEAHITQEQLRRYWAIISPASHATRFRGRDFRSLMIWGAYDPVFLPAHSREVIASFRPTRALRLPCGHYTLG
jgi:pimeloyl-ACP methyl ester carboxylesterase